MQIKKNIGSHAGGNLETGPPLISNKSPFDLKTSRTKKSNAQPASATNAGTLSAIWRGHLILIQSKWPDLSQKEPTAFAYLGKP